MPTLVKGGENPQVQQEPIARGGENPQMQQEQLAAARNDIYGIGFRLYRERYDLSRNGDAPVLTPFASFPPLDPAEVRKVFEEDD